MTIIKPNKNKSFVKFLLAVLGIIFIGGGFYIFEYNSFVNVRHERNTLKKSIVEMQFLNVDLKNQFYRAIAPANLETMAAAGDLVLEKRPAYLSD